MAYDAFLKLDDVEGEVTAEGHEGEIELKDFSFGVENVTTIGSATGGAGAGKATFHELTVTKPFDKSSTVLFQKCASGAHFEKARITLRKAGGSSQDEFLKYDLATLFVTRIDWAAAEDGDDRPAEEVDFLFGVVHITYTAPDGTVDEAGWDIIRNVSA